MAENGWNEWSKFVLKTLERYENNFDDTFKRINKLEIKAGMWGALAGIVTSLITIILQYFLSQ